MAGLLIFGAIVPVILFLPGFALLTRLQWLKSSLERFAFAPFVGLLLAAGLGLAQATKLLSGAQVVAITLIVIALSIWQLIVFKRYVRVNKEIVRLFLVLIAFFLITTSYIFLPLVRDIKYVPDPEAVNGSNYNVLNVKILNLAKTAANDNFVPYRQAQFFQNHINIREQPYLQPEWGVTFFFRTPLMGLVTSYFFDISMTQPPLEYPWRVLQPDTSHSYLKFQLLAHSLNGLLILSGYLVIRKLFSKRVALISVALLSINAFFIYNAFFSWPKSFVAFFVLAALYVILQYRNYFVAGVIIGFAYLAHDLAMLYAAGLFFMAITETRHRLKHSILLIAPVIVFISPWYLISRVIYRQSSLFIYYPFSLAGIPQSGDGLIADFFRASPFKILSIKLQSLAFLVTPYQFLFEKGKFHDLYWGMVLFSLPGAVGLALFPCALVELWLKWKKYWRVIIAMVIIPVLMAISFIGWPMGLGATHFAQPTVFLLSSFGVALLLRQKKWLKALVIALLVLQSGFFLFMGFDYIATDFISSIKEIAKVMVFISATVSVFVLALRQLLPWQKARQIH